MYRNTVSASPKPDAESERRALESIPRAVRTVNLSVVISLVSLLISLFTLFWNVRPARIEPIMSAIYVSGEGGLHLSVPLSIVNSGARSSAIRAAKLIESDGKNQFLWVADFTADPSQAIPAMTGALTPMNSALWVPFQVPGNSQIERVFVFRPDSPNAVTPIASGRTVDYRVVLLLAGNTEVGAGTTITWPSSTDGVLRAKQGGVGSMGADLDRWFSGPSP